MWYIPALKGHIVYDFYVARPRSTVYLLRNCERHRRLSNAAKQRPDLVLRHGQRDFDLSPDGLLEEFCSDTSTGNIRKGLRR